MVLPLVDSMSSLRYSAETMPCETDCSRPNGLPMVMTQSPTERSDESPTSMGVTESPLSSAFITARSDELSEPTTVAS